jgi:hypothetical protein
MYPSTFGLVLTCVHVSYRPRVLRSKAGEAAVKHQVLCDDWSVRFKEGREDLQDDPRSRQRKTLRTEYEPWRAQIEDSV